MHLGRFHATIFDLARHFEEATLPAMLEKCSVALDQYAQAKTDAQLDAFRSSFSTLMNAAEVKEPDLKQPYALQVIADLSVADTLDPNLPLEIRRIVQERVFDHAGIAADFRALAAAITKKTSQISVISKAFVELEVEYERVGEAEAEVGILIPREIIGHSLPELTSEFNKLGKLFRAINELTKAPDYDPKVRTISSSWWQIFLDLGPAQILVWIVAVERIVALFKSNLEIKDLQQKLSSNDMPKKITDLIEEEIDKRVSASIQALAEDICKNHRKIDDKGRLNEIETQLRQGLYHLAKRINQGSQVEINVGVPEAPEEPPAVAEGEEANQELQEQIESTRARVAELRALRARSQAASTETLKIDGKSQTLLKYFEKDDDDSKASTAGKPAPQEQSSS